MKTDKAAKHTPGPWNISGRYIMSSENDNPALCSTIAEVYGGDLANTRLIAVAPDQNAVLKKIAAKITDAGYRSIQVTGQLGIYLDKAEIDELRAVIAKAEVR